MLWIKIVSVVGFLNLVYVVHRLYKTPKHKDYIVELNEVDKDARKPTGRVWRESVSATNVAVAVDSVMDSIEADGKERSLWPLKDVKVLSNVVQ